VAPPINSSSDTNGTTAGGNSNVNNNNNLNYNTGKQFPESDISRGLPLPGIRQPADLATRRRRRNAEPVSRMLKMPAYLKEQSQPSYQDYQPVLYNYNQQLVQQGYSMQEGDNSLVPTHSVPESVPVRSQSVQNDKQPAKSESGPEATSPPEIRQTILSKMAEGEVKLLKDLIPCLYEI
jgi:hypothetical protein